MDAKRKSQAEAPIDSSILDFLTGLSQEVEAKMVDFSAFPDVAVRIRQVLADDNCSPADVARVIGVEPGMSARLLQMANSVALNPSGTKVTELKTAIARIGFSNVRTASIAYAMEQLRKSSELVAIREPLSELWERSVKVAAMAHVAARRWSSVSPDKALLAGLMHGIGHAYILVRSVNYPALFSDPAAYERVAGEWHAPVAKAVLDSWEMAPEIVAAVEQFEQFDRETGDEADLTDVLAIAVQLVAFQNDPEVMEAELRKNPASLRMGLTHESVKKVLVDTADELASLNAVLGG